MRKIYAHIKYFLLLLCIGVSFALHASEYISQIVSDITIYEDATVAVTETITVHAQGAQIKRGIFREFPTVYSTWWGKETIVPFKVIAIKRDGFDEPYHLERASNGIRIYIGKKDTTLPPGDYTFSISYTTGRQLGFYADYDEFAWNVNGAGSRFPIHSIQAQVHLPAAIPDSVIHTQAYTGFVGQKGKDYSITGDGHTVKFSSTRTFEPGENMTIVLTWPKGFVRAPSLWQRLWWWFSDMLGLIILWFITMISFMYFIVLYFWSQASRQKYIIIPRFYPPKNMLPSVVRMVRRRSYDTQGLAAELVDMAVKGYVKIVYKKGWWSGMYYLEKKNTPDESAHSLHQKLYDILFKIGDHVALDNSSHRLITLLNTVTQRYGETETTGLFISYSEALALGFFVAMAAMCLLWYFFSALFFASIIAGCVVGISTVVCALCLNYYTLRGQEVKAEIEGFVLFLTTAETERMKIIGTPPDRTPELYETYLPYAIAFGVEKQWTQQFASVFAKMAAAGHPYAPAWQVSPLGYSFIAQPTLFSSQFSRAVNTPISSSPTAPGTGTSSGGRGSSGSGGGGGGVGGW